MPHLSPMNWIMSISMLWLILMSISSSFWWSQSNMFHSPSFSVSKMLKSFWKWN